MTTRIRIQRTLLRPGLIGWIFFGTLAVLLPVFAFLTIENINRQKNISLQLMAQKGATIIRSFEAGARIGMLEMQWGLARLQRLVSEIALQPDIEFIQIADIRGNIIVHNDADQVGKLYRPGMQLNTAATANMFQSKIIHRAGGDQVFVIYKIFSPVRGTDMPMMGNQRGRRRMPHMNNWLTDDMKITQNDQPGEYLIFVGLKMDAYQADRRADIRKSILTAVGMLVVGLAGIMVIFLAQAYRSARTSLSHVRAFSEKVMKQMPMGLIALDPEKKISDINEAAESLFGISAGKVVGRSADEVLPAAIMQPVRDLKEHHSAISREITCEVGLKQNHHLQLSAATIFDEHRTFLGHVLLVKDLNEIQSLRDQIARNQRLATVGRLAAGVAHEIRNPLSSIKGFATYFKERYKDETEDQSISNIMIQEVERLNRVVGELLDFSKPVSLSKKPMPLKAFLADSLIRIETLAADKNVVLELEAIDEKLSIRLDPDKMNQVLLNLYLNAMDSMDGAGLIRIGASPADGNRVSIRIADSGRGIAPEKLSKIFDPYFTTKSTGTGLGLAIAHNIIEAHEGRIQVESSLGEGTRITLTLPMEASA